MCFLNSLPHLLGERTRSVVRSPGSDLVRATAQQCLALVIEDVHWADQDTLLLLNYLADQRLPRLVLILSQRTGSPPSQLLSKLCGNAETLSLGPLSKEECREFLTDLCTPAELEAMVGRWKVARMLKDGLSYREIYSKSGVSTATVTRVARCVTLGTGGYRLALKRREEGAPK